MNQILQYKYNPPLFKQRLEVFYKKVLLKISQNSQENICARVSFLRPATLY